MQILDIPASELHVNDILDEGMEIWLIVTEPDAPPTKRSIFVRYGDNTNSLIKPSPGKNFVNYRPTDIVRVMRRDNGGEEGTD